LVPPISFSLFCVSIFSIKVLLFSFMFWIYSLAFYFKFIGFPNV
jgi:hypothetical protein